MDGGGDLSGGAPSCASTRFGRRCLISCDLGVDIYVNNVPNGSIPFLSSAMGSNFSTFRGLVPGKYRIRPAYLVIFCRNQWLESLGVCLLRFLVFAKS